VSETKNCPECNGKCCRDIDTKYRVAHMGAEVYEHWCEACHDGKVPLATVNLDWLIRSLCNVAEELADAAVLERNEWKGKYERVQAENDALKAQLERIKAALGV
jgi:cytochrome c5